MGRFVRSVVPAALLIGPALYTLDIPNGPGMSLLGALCLGAGLSGAYALLEQIAKALSARHGD